MHELIETYGKRDVQWLLDSVYINGKIDEKEAYEFLHRHKIITRNTKYIHVHSSITSWGDFNIIMRNASHDAKLWVRLTKAQLDELKRELNQAA